MYQNFEYTRVLHMPQVEKMPGFGMNQASECQVSEYASGSEYARISQASECARITPEYVL